MFERTKIITGDRFGKLVAVRAVRVEQRNAVWEFQCDCGNTKEATGNNVRMGRVRSCGCLRAKKGKP